MIAKKYDYELYRLENKGSDNYGEVIQEKVPIKKVVGNKPYETVVSITEDRYLTKKTELRIIVDGILDSKGDLYLTDGVATWQIINIVPYETFFNRTMLKVALLR